MGFYDVEFGFGDCWEGDLDLFLVCGGCWGLGYLVLPSCCFEGLCYAVVYGGGCCGCGCIEGICKRGVDFFGEFCVEGAFVGF